MRRPLVFILLAYSSGIIVRFFWDICGIWLIASIAAALAVFFIAKNKNAKISILLMVIALLGGLLFDIRDSRKSSLHPYNCSNSVCEGYVLNVKEKNSEYHQLVIDVDKAEIKNKVIYPNEKVLFSVYGKYPEIYDLTGKRIRISGEISVPSKSRNPKLFDYQLYLKSNDIYTIATSAASGIKVMPAKIRVIPNLLSRFKFGFIEKLSKHMDEQSVGLLVGVLFGDKNYMDQDIYDAFQKNGTAHILSVSGIHIAIIYGFLESLFNKKNSKVKDVFIAAVLLMYAALSEFSPPVSRSVFMIIVYIASKLFFRRYDLTSSTSFTALALMLQNPFVLFNTGFQLTYAAVFSIAAVQPFIENKIKIKNKASELIGPMIAVNAGLIPITAYIFNYFSWSSFFMNIPVIILSDIILPIGFFLMILSFLGGYLFIFACLTEEFLIKSMIWINKLTVNEGIGFINIPSPSVIVIFAYYLVLFYFASELRITFKPKNREKLIAFVLGGLLILCIAVPNFKNEKDIIFLDVGQGDCIHVRTPKGRNILIDGGGSKDPKYDVGKRILLPYLYKNGAYKIDLAVISHFDTDHYQGIYSIMKEMKIDRMASFEGNRITHKKLMDEMKTYCSEIVFLKKGDRLDIEDGIWMKVLYPETEREYSANNIENEACLVLELFYKNKKILFTGDIDADAEKRIISEVSDLNADIVKVPHHGSKYSSSKEFISKVNPKAAIIQVGKNNFGHPDPSVIERYKKEDIMIFRTDYDGAVMIDIENGKTSIETMLNGEAYEL